VYTDRVQKDVDAREQGQARPPRPVRSRLGLRLGIIITLIVLITAGVGMLLDFRRAYRKELTDVFRSLRTVAHSVEPARRRITQANLLGRFLTNFVIRMDASVAPGHHVVVFDDNGAVLAAAAHQGADLAKETFPAAGPQEELVRTSNGPMAVFRLHEPGSDDGGATVLVARHLDQTLDALRQDLSSRALQILIIAAEIILLVFVAIHFAVIRPVKRLVQAARAWSARDFYARVDPAGSPEFLSLCAEFNLMASELSEHEERRLAELREARKIQARLLPGAIPEVRGVEVAARYQPAAEIGGDLYDVFVLPRGQVAAAVLDVAGHGISAALLTGVVRMSLRYHLHDGGDLLTAIHRINDDMLASSPDERFVTMCLGVWNPDQRTWTYVAAGHPGGTLLTAGGARSLGSTGPVLGAQSSKLWSVERLELAVGDRLFLFSDGVVEAGAPRRMLGMAGVADLLAASAHHTLTQQVDELVHAARLRQQDGHSDDLTILAMEVEGDGPVLGEH